MKKFDWKPVKDIAELIIGVASYGLVIAASNKIVKNVTDDYIGIAGYDEAVGAIMRSGMYSHDKCKAVEALKRNEDAEYYKAIIHIAKDSRLYSHDKTKLIEGLSE